MQRVGRICRLEKVQKYNLSASNFFRRLVFRIHGAYKTDLHSRLSDLLCRKTTIISHTVDED